MKMELNDEMMENVTGGTVIISKNTMNVGFSTLGEKYKLTGCTYKEARDLRDDELEKDLGLNNLEFDKHMRQLYADRKWIKL